MTKVNIKLYATGLKNVAGAFKGTSDPYAVATLLAGDPNEKPRVLGKTEVYVKGEWKRRFNTPLFFRCTILNLFSDMTFMFSESKTR